MFSAKEEKLRNPSYYMRGETFHSEVYSHSRSLHREISRFSRFVAAARATVASLTTSNSSSGSIGRRSGRFVNAVNANVWRINRGACYELSIVLSPLIVCPPTIRRDRDHFLVSRISIRFGENSYT